MAASAILAPPEPATGGALHAPGSRRALAGFFVSGMLLSLLGAILPSWGHHLTDDYDTVGAYFLAISFGLLISPRVGSSLLRRKGTGFVMTVACVIACGSLIYLAAFPPPASAWFRVAGLTGIGLAAGILHAAIFHAISPMYRHDPAATVNLGGTLFGLGCLSVALLLSGTFYVYSVRSTLIVLAIVPGLLAIAYGRVRFLPPRLDAPRRLRDAVRELRSPVAVLFSLLLFFQFGNEWAIAGWLPTFLTHRLGISPAKALLLLAVYWLALMVGRIVAQSILTHVNHGKLLFVSVSMAMFGCFILMFTDSLFGAVTGVLLVGAGFAPVYPLVVEKIGDQFPYYQPGFYNGIFSLALTGGLLAPCSLGFLAPPYGVGVIMLLPLLGTVMVLLLLLSIWAWPRFTRQGRRMEAAPSGPS